MKGIVSDDETKSKDEPTRKISLVNLYILAKIKKIKSKGY